MWSEDLLRTGCNGNATMEIVVSLMLGYSDGISNPMLGSSHLPRAYYLAFTTVSRLRPSGLPMH